VLNNVLEMLHAHNQVHSSHEYKRKKNKTVKKYQSQTHSYLETFLTFGSLFYVLVQIHQCNTDIKIMHSSRKKFLPAKEKTPVSTATKITLTYRLPEQGMTCRSNSPRNTEKLQ